jgi:peptidyl-prolyl cis-trans isomerase D
MVQTAFTLEEGQESLLQEADSGYYVVRVDAAIPAAPRPFAEVRDQVVAQWEAAQRQRQAEALAESLAKEAAPPASLKSLAGRSPAISHTRTPAVTRSGDPVEGAAEDAPDRALTARLFDMDVGQTAAVPTQQGAVVLRLAEVVAADPKGNGTGVAQLRDSLKDDMADDILAQMTQAFSMRYGVEVNREAIEAAF